MLGFKLDVWDYLTFATAALAGFAVLGAFVWLAGLPGRIALARKHPEAEAVKLLGWAGLLPTIVPWIQAFVWAFKPSTVVDIRRYPDVEDRDINKELAQLRGQPVAVEPEVVRRTASSADPSTGAPKP